LQATQTIAELHELQRVRADVNIIPDIDSAASTKELQSTIIALRAEITALSSQVSVSGVCCLL
jgi:hypothetical protein